MSGPEVFEIEERPRERPGWLRHWDWFLVLSIAWLVFDLFMQPVLSVVIASIKFGWSDFANGFWLWRRDSNYRRGRAFALFYTATGLWRITVTTFAVTLLGLLILGFVMAADGPPAGANAGDDDGARVAAVSMLIVMLCFVMSSICTWAAIYLALRNGVRVWIDATVRYSRRNRVWPPRPTGKNQLSRVMTSSLIFLCVTVCGATLGVFLNLAQRGGRIPDILIPLPVVAVVACALVLLIGRAWLLKKLSAACPDECWA